MALLTLTSTVSGATVYIHDLTIVEVSPDGTGSMVYRQTQDDGAIFGELVDEAPSAIVAAADVLYELVLEGGTASRFINAKRVASVEENPAGNAVITFDRAGAKAQELVADADGATEAAAIGALI